MNVPAPTTPAMPFADSAEVRSWLIEQLRLDLIGPGPEDTALHDEALTQAPSRWYLTGYLVPIGAPEEQRAGDADAEGELDSGDDAGGTDDQATPDRASARKAWRPSSIGLSFLLEPEVDSVEVEAVWGDYTLIVPKPAKPKEDGGPEAREDATGVSGSAANEEKWRWQREHRAEKISVGVSQDGRSDLDVPASGGLQLSVLVRRTPLRTETGERQVKAVSIFLVNRRDPIEESERADEACAFQAGLIIASATPFIARPDVRGLDGKDWDDRVADLHYRDVAELAVGHNVSADWWVEDGVCRRIATTWAPLAAVPRVVPNLNIPDFELAMETLGAQPDATTAKASLSGVVSGYRTWIDTQRGTIKTLAKQRQEVAEQLLVEAEAVANRIADGIACLEKPYVLEAFRIANRAIARAARQREAQIRGIKPDEVDPPRWYPFQLAFILLNLRGVAEPGHDDRKQVDLLFFPTGGGKTEAYLGLAAFAIAHRRLVNPDLTGAGVTVLMRYTLRLLTLDQLGRAAAVVCALELERQAGTAKLGSWPVEIGLWVGRAATPNRMGHKGDNDSRHTTARWKVIDYRNKTNRPTPVPIRTCPWCGTPFERDSFHLVDANGKADFDNPVNLELRCVNRACEFHLSKKPLPVLTVDEPIYRRLPAFMIATVDKFAGMPWTGNIASFFGAVDRSDGTGFLGASTPTGGVPLPRPLLPPDLIIQDELHLISGPLGTMVGLYETVLDRLCTREIDGKAVRPKIIASTATVRRAERQIRALFERRQVTVFPPPGPDRRTTFFAEILGADEPGARRYFGLAAPGGSPKVVFLRTLVTLMAAAQTAWARGKPNANNPADPFMTLLSYFNALRELGGARRIVEGEVGPRLANYHRRLRVGEAKRFEDRQIAYDVMELTSRVSTDDVSEAKRRLGTIFSDRKDRVDVALATNMISVGLDISRLGLMVVSGQPKSTAEYIQATSRIGRDASKPGLVVTLLNVNKPRDRSHYERFKAWHSAFYRGVEATSVTPFSPRALDRALAAVTVGLGRLALSQFTPSTGAQLADTQRGALDVVADVIAARAAEHDGALSLADQQRLRDNVRQRTADILDDWAKIAAEVGMAGGKLGYQKEPGVNTYLLRDMLDREPLPPHKKRFRAPRSLRDVEAAVLIKLETPTGQSLDS